VATSCLRPALEVRRARGSFKRSRMAGARFAVSHHTPGSVVSRGLLKAISGVQLNSTRLDESLLSGLGLVLSDAAASSASQAASLANVTAVLTAMSADQAAAIANVTAALAAAQVRLACRASSSRGGTCPFYQSCPSTLLDPSPHTCHVQAQQFEVQAVQYALLSNVTATLAVATTTQAEALANVTATIAAMQVRAPSFCR
jgi:hypothetical protein